ncbi:MAG: hypothetical protein KDD40_03555 [Bdellovibrionales bacterium]|nr:hypothetical protein [Bdellovibrionales bacterium]
MNDYTKVQTLQDLDNIYDTLCLSTVITRSLNYLSTKVSADNIVWLLDTEVNDIYNQKEQYQMHSKLDSKVYLSGQSQFKTEDIVKRILSFEVLKKKKKHIFG